MKPVAVSLYGFLSAAVTLLHAVSRRTASSQGDRDGWREPWPHRRGQKVHARPSRQRDGSL